MNTGNSKPHTMKVVVGFVALLAAVLFFVSVPAVRATSIVVNTTEDKINNAGDCSLREAVIAANEDRAVDGCPAGKGADTISLPAGSYKFEIPGPGEDSSATGDLDITADLTLIGAGKGNTIIDATGLDRVLHIIGGKVTISKVTLTNGFVDGPGGAVQLYSGQLTMLDTRVRDSEAKVATFNYGGGIYALTGSLALVATQVDHNLAYGGGGIYVPIASLTMTDSWVRNNTADQYAGVFHAGSAVIRNSLISGNSAVGSAILPGLNLTGGMRSFGPLTMVNSTISGNTATEGTGGLLIYSEANLLNVTIANNTANTNGAVTGAGAGGLDTEGLDAIAHISHTLIAGNVNNKASAGNEDCGGNIESQDYNLISDTDDCVLLGQATHDRLDVNPLLGPLADNGGPTKTHALSVFSPAADGGDPQGCRDEKGALLMVDQRGFIRPVNGDVLPGARCDIGAFERNSPGPPAATPTTTATPTKTATLTPTVSATATKGPPPSATATATGGPSSTPSATATEGPSPTPTKTPQPTKTATPGPSPTPTATATEGPSPTPTATPTNGPSPTPSATATVGPSPTPFLPSYWLYLPISFSE